MVARGPIVASARGQGARGRLESLVLPEGMVLARKASSLGRQAQETGQSQGQDALN